MTMAKFGILLKSYAGDVAYAERFVASFHKHNVEGLPLFIVVPRAELEKFAALAHPCVELIAEEDVCDGLARGEVSGIRPGYINQEVIKLAFWEAGRCENYLCADSDGIFIRDFGLRDFMFDADTPYTVLVEDNELRVEPEYFGTHWQARELLIRRIQERIGMAADRPILTCHGFAIFSSRVLASFKASYLEPRGQRYLDAIADSPYEFSWYNMWLQHAGTIAIHPREHLFKYFHHKNQHVEYRIKGITEMDLARGYVGVVVNSNYSRGYGLVEYSDSIEKLLARYFRMADLLKAVFRKGLNKLKGRRS